MHVAGSAGIPGVAGKQGQGESRDLFVGDGLFFFECERLFWSLRNFPLVLCASNDPCCLSPSTNGGGSVLPSFAIQPFPSKFRRTRSSQHPPLIFTTQCLSRQDQTILPPACFFFLRPLYYSFHQALAFPISSLC